MNSGRVLKRLVCGISLIAIAAFTYFFFQWRIPEKTNVFYGGGFAHTSQGSEAYPYVWYQALEQKDSTELFSANLERYSLIPGADDVNNPLRLPIGLTVAVQDAIGKPAIGMSCAACHTSRIEYQGKGITIEGGSGMFDSTLFFNDLYFASMQTIQDPEKRFRFLQRYLGAKSRLGRFFRKYESREAMKESSKFTRLLLEEVDQLVDREFQTLEAYFEENPHQGPTEIAFNDSENIPEKHRLIDYRERLKDHPILEEVPDVLKFWTKFEGSSDRHGILSGVFTNLAKDMRLGLAALQFLKNFASAEFGPESPPGAGRVDAFGKVRNLILPLAYGKDVIKPATAPVSIPALWSVNETEWLHWNGNTNSTMQRNILEALGSGGMVDMKKYDSTVNFEKLDVLEKLVREFIPPPWPVNMFGELDSDRVERGKEIYEGSKEEYKEYRKGNCAECHNRFATIKDGLTVYPQYSLREIGTDPNHAENFNRLVEGGGTFPEVIEELSEKIKQRYYKKHDIPVEEQEAWENNRTDIEWRSPIDAPLPAKTLEGIWSTAPYLHNGSVPTLHHLLSPVAERPKTFSLGHWEYEPKLVGYTLEESTAPFTFNVDEIVSDGGGHEFPEFPNGNSNAGHEYGVDLNNEERLDLLEYLKSL